MNTLISLLRGVNVGGKNKLAMSDLKALCAELKFVNVTTFIQSGNVVFSVEKGDSRDISKKLESGIDKKFGLSVPVITRTVEEMEKAVVQNPYSKLKDKSIESLYISYLERAPKAPEIAAVRGYSYPPDEFRIMGQEVYIHCPNGYGNTKLNNNFFENKLKIRATTRNWKTSNELLNMALKIRELS